MLSLKADSKWGLNHTSKLLCLALLLVSSLHILTWNSRRCLLQLPCPLESSIPDSHPPDLPPQRPAASGNSYFPASDSDTWHCRQHREVEVCSFPDWLRGNFTDEQVLCAAHRQSQLPLPSPVAAGPPRIAFLFITRGPIPFEPLWRRFFASHESRFSIYLHIDDPDYSIPSNSLFRHHPVIPSRPIQKYDSSLPEAARRLLAYALLDTTVPNAWFHLACDASVPIRSFDYVYDYITHSTHSFVESFYATSQWWRKNWIANATMIIPDELMRKGEFWVTLHRRHAGLVVGDQYVFPRFKHNWHPWGLLSEVYIATLMAVTDPEGVANHSLVYVNWLNHTKGTSSPVTFDERMVTKAAIEGMQNMTANVLGFYQIDKVWNDETEKSCVYNGVANSPCFLFARKFTRDGSVVKRLGELRAVLGY